MILLAGREGKLPRSSRSESEELIASGICVQGTDTKTTTKAVERKLLMISNVNRYDNQVWRTRGACPRMATRRINVAIASNGKTRTRGTKSSRGQIGTGFGTLGRTSGASWTGICA